MEYLSSAYMYLFNPNDDVPEPISTPILLTDLLKWDPSTDYNASFNVVRIPLQGRAKHNPFHSKIAAVFRQSIQPSQGSDTFQVFNFTYWQYIDIFICWRWKPVTKCIIVPPAPSWIAAAHKNGVKIYGTVYFPSGHEYGNITDVEYFVTRNSTESTFPAADKLILMAQTLGFDGWFINQETPNGNPELAKQMQEFLQYLNTQTEVMWLDAMDVNGEYNPQSELNSYNSQFLTSSIFLKYNWDSKALESSQDAALSKSMCPNVVYAGIDASADQQCLDQVLKEIHCGPNDISLTSIGIHNADWPYTHQKNISTLQFNAHETEFWKKIGKYKTPENAITSAPWITNFNVGQGTAYFIRGQKISDKRWNSIQQQDILPTYRHNVYCKLNFDHDTVYTGGSSFAIKCRYPFQSTYNLPIFDTELDIDNDLIFEFTYLLKYGIYSATIVLEFEEGKEEFKLHPVGTWQKLTHKMSQDYTTLNRISINMWRSYVCSNPFELYLGEMSILPTKSYVINKPTNAHICAREIVGGSAQLNITWDVDELVSHYYLYRVTSGGTVYLGRTSNHIYHLSIAKHDDMETTIIIVPISRTGNKGEFAEINLVW